MVNPYFCYSLAFATALLLYPLGWSGLYPPLTTSVVVFVALTILFHVFAGMLFSKKGCITRSSTPDSQQKNAVNITLVIYALWVAEFVYAGGVPLIQILLRRSYDYKTFGIPTLHVFVVTFSSFYTIFLFQQYLGNRSVRVLLLFIINLSAALLIYNRGMFLFNLSACLFLFLIYKRRITLRQVAIGTSGIIVTSYLFGVMGSLRVSNESKVPYSNEGFLSTGSATAAFRNSGVPGEFFWTYVYTTSPLANLQENISVNASGDIGFMSLAQWFNNEVLPDFISKRINHYAGSGKQKVKTIPGPFNATTVYSGSYSYAGWWGVVLMMGVILMIPVLYTRLVPPASPFFLSGLVIINTIFLFMIFDNTLRFTGLSFQVVYPILLHAGMNRMGWIRTFLLK